jgi:hypothetical protein
MLANFEGICRQVKVMHGGDTRPWLDQILGDPWKFNGGKTLDYGEAMISGRSRILRQIWNWKR